MTSDSGADPLSHPLASSPHQPLLPDTHTGFSTHQSLLVAILTCLQERNPRRRAPPLRLRDEPSNHRWVREPAGERESTPCIVMREHHDRGELSVADLSLARIDLQTQPLAGWMRVVAPASSQPDRDTVHLAMAPTLPGVPMLVHTIGASGDAATHLFFEGVWSLGEDHRFLLRAIRYAQLVATTIPLPSRPGPADSVPALPQAAAAQPHGDGECADLVALGRRYDHSAVHAAIRDLGELRRSQQQERAPPLPGHDASGL